VYRLRPPPRGHYWVRVDNDVLLTAIATGLIVDVAYNLFY
jgi:Ni/Co efflux regulator RcnB